MGDVLAVQHYNPLVRSSRSTLGALLDLLVMRRKLDKSIAEIFLSLKRYVEMS